jgi:hypothetical protein
MNFCPGSKNSIIGKTPRKLEDMTELSMNYVTFKGQKFKVLFKVDTYSTIQHKLSGAFQTYA